MHAGMRVTHTEENILPGMSTEENPSVPRASAFAARADSRGDSAVLYCAELVTWGGGKGVRTCEVRECIRA